MKKKPTPRVERQPSSCLVHTQNKQKKLGKDYSCYSTFSRESCTENFKTKGPLKKRKLKASKSTHRRTCMSSDDSDFKHKKRQQPKPDYMTGNCSSDAVYTCDICRKQFLSKNQLKSHKRLHLPFEYRCQWCPRQFKMEHSYRLHKMSHIGEELHECEDCHKKFESEHSLNTHKIVHLRPKMHMCFICGKMFSSKHILVNHQTLHFILFQYNCKLCGKSFTRENKLRSHLGTHSKSDTACHLCEKIFVNINQLRRHLYVDHRQNSTEPDVLKTYTCSFCDVQLKLSQLKSHLQLHMGIRVQCKTCEEVFSENVKFEQHLKIHNEQNITNSTVD